MTMGSAGEPAQKLNKFIVYMQEHHNLSPRSAREAGSDEIVYMCDGIEIGIKVSLVREENTNELIYRLTRNINDLGSSSSPLVKLGDYKTLEEAAEASRKFLEELCQKDI
jgi:hypothetical protein